MDHPRLTRPAVSKEASELPSAVCRALFARLRSVAQKLREEGGTVDLEAVLDELEAFLPLERIQSLERLAQVALERQYGPISWQNRLRAVLKG